MLTTQTETVLLQLSIGPDPVAWNKSWDKVHNISDFICKILYLSLIQWKTCKKWVSVKIVSYDVSYKLKRWKTKL